MRLSIVVWEGGENNPFPYFANSLKVNLEAHGCQVCLHTLPERSDAVHVVPFVKGLLKFEPDLVLTFQGLGSTLQLSPNYKNIWEQFNLKLLAMHGDHPSLMPANHVADSPYVYNVYHAPKFAEFLNLYFNPQHRAELLMPISYAHEQSGSVFEGDFFVLPKNLDDTELLKREYSQSNKLTAKILSEAVSLLDQALRQDGCCEHHHLLDSVVFGFTELKDRFEAGDQQIKTYHMTLHGVFDKYYRNKFSELVIGELHSVPLKIYGRGWDRFQVQNNTNHTYHTGLSLSRSSTLFESNYGIIDISPTYHGLHDRTLRAMSRGASFLIGSNFCEGFKLFEDFSHLFYDATIGNLAMKAESVMRNPAFYRESVVSFRRLYDQEYSMSYLVSHFKRIATLSC